MACHFLTAEEWYQYFLNAPTCIYFTVLHGQLVCVVLVLIISNPRLEFGAERKTKGVTYRA